MMMEQNTTPLKTTAWEAKNTPDGSINKGTIPWVV